MTAVSWRIFHILSTDNTLQRADMQIIHTLLHSQNSWRISLHRSFPTQFPQIAGVAERV